MKASEKCEKCSRAIVGTNIKVHHDGKGRAYDRCRHCHNDYMREAMRRRYANARDPETIVNEVIWKLNYLHASERVPRKVADAARLAADILTGAAPQ